MPTRANALAATLVLIALGCSSEPEPEEPDLANLEGIYEVERWTLNPETCTDEGDPHPEARDYLFFKSTRFFFEEVLLGAPCDDVDACRADAEEISLFGSALGTYYEDPEEPDTGWPSMHSMAYSITHDSCGGSVTHFYLTEPAQGEIRIDKSVTEVTFPLEGDEGCTTDQAERVAQDMPCSRGEVIHAEKIAEL
ncbi:MAG: hypothetical protein EA397_11360 [Deltaproteobacteria bacterium]|nr:MAG: hypothetical protein EA397_11360 [Deltaproteobacteria bacterium]